MAVGDSHVFPGFLTPVLTQLSFQSHRLLFPHASAEVRGENTPERKFASTGSRTHDHQVMSPTLSHPGGVVTVILRCFAKEPSKTLLVLPVRLPNETHFHTMPHFDALRNIYSCRNIVRKGEIACNKQFLLFSQCFLPNLTLIFHFKCT